ncbi:MAG: beta-galactosidase trimerization domain-containing protein, partial [Anaerolineae bacterium]|nr:beta-galactosidase trimerization domain-containing protein [Anaerolineae bacterium]
ITFGGFHFRWSFVDEWPQLLDVLRQIVESCHRYGIKVIEHHSAILTHNPQGEEEWAWTMRVRHKQGVDLTRHPGFMRGLREGDLLYKGVWLSQMRQIDPRTGQFARTNYRGWALCFNNPLWRKLYFEHLEEIYATGVDGIMTDDIQFWPVGFGCGCPHCRRAFTEATGYEMPPNGLDDPEFYGNMDNPAYRAWIIWRTQSTAEHHQRVTEHFRRLGYELCRPFYSSSDTTTWAVQGLGGMVENVAHLMSTVFTEVCSFDAQAHAWPWEGAEAQHRNALARRHGIPSMCLFYPHNKEENLFCWALTKSWGQRYWGCNSQLSFQEETEMLKPTFTFEAAHPEIYERPESLAEVGVLFSAQTRNTYKGMDDQFYVREWCGWCETLMRANIPYDVITDPDLAERRYLERLRLLILPNAAHLSSKQLAALEAFVRAGGKAILTHETGCYDEMGTRRADYPLAKLIGAALEGTSEQASVWRPLPGAPIPSSKLHSSAPVALFRPLDAQPWAILEGTDYAAVFVHPYGQGQVLTFAGKPGLMSWIGKPAILSPDPQVPPTGHLVNYDRNEAVVELMLACVRYLLGSRPLLLVKGAPDGLLVSLYRQRGNALAIHLVNAAGTLADNHREIPVPAPLSFPKLETLPGGAPAIELRIRFPGERAALFSPERKERLELPVRREKDYTVISLPAEGIHCYSVIHLR